MYVNILYCFGIYTSFRFTLISQKVFLNRLGLLNSMFTDPILKVLSFKEFLKVWFNSNFVLAICAKY